MAIGNIHLKILLHFCLYKLKQLYNNTVKLKNMTNVFKLHCMEGRSGGRNIYKIICNAMV